LQEKVTLTGFISEEEKIDLLQRAAVHLQSSYKEGWGLSVIEANACGCPVVANDTTGLRDSCRDNETGLLYKHCDIDDAASKIQKILTDKPLRDRLVKKGYEWANTFSWERNSQEILALLEKISTTHRKS
jgi:glycosyltransferase involved in cell wall biosynthesis